MWLGESVLELWKAQSGMERLSLAQVDALPPIVPVIATPQIFVAIVAGLLMAFAFQLFLTSLGIAIGVTALGFQISRRRKEVAIDAEIEAEPPEVAEPSRVGDTVRTIGFAAGLGILLTINAVLFAACFLAAKLSLVTSPFVGAILGVVIWSAYFLILTWVSSTAVTSLVGTILGSAAAGFRTIVSTASAAFKGQADPDRYLTEAAAVKTIRQEVKSALSSGDIQDTLKEYVVSLQPPQIDLGAVRQEFQSLLQSPEAASLMGSNLMGSVNRQTFVELIRDRSDLSHRDAEQVVEQLSSLWEQALAQPPQSNRMQNLLNFLQSASPDELTSDASPKLQLLESIESDSEEAGSENGLLRWAATELRPSIQARFSNLDFHALKQAVLNRVDLSELDVETVWQQLKELRQSIAGDAAEPPFSTIRADAEGFLLGAYVWDLGHQALKDQFREVIYDADAAPSLVKQQLEALSSQDFAEILQQRDDLQPQKIEKIVDRLESVRQDILEIVTAASDEPSEELPAVQPVSTAAAELWRKLESYLRYTKAKRLTPKNVDRKLETLLEEASAEVLKSPQSDGKLRLPPFDRSALEHLLARRKGLESDQIEQILAQVAQAWQPFSTAPADTEQTRIDGRSPVADHRLTQILSDLFQQVDLSMPDSQQQLIERLGELGIGSWAVKSLKEVDWQSIAAQSHLSSSQVQKVAHSAKAAIYRLAKAPRRWATRTQKTAWDFGDRLQTYLLSVEKADLTPEAIQTNLTRLLHDAERHGLPTEPLLASFPTAVTASLSQRDDLTESEAQQAIEQIEAVRLRLQAQMQQTQDSQRSALESLLAKLRRSIDALQRPDLDPDHLKQDLYKLLDLPQAGLSMLSDSAGEILNLPIDAIRDRLSHFNRDTLAKLMQTRDDFSEAVSSRVIEQVEGVRDQVMQQVEQIQLEAQRQLDDLKQQAQKQAETTRKAATIAAWWLFCTALTSLTSAAVAGIIGVTGIHISGFNIGNWSF